MGLRPGGMGSGGAGLRPGGGGAGAGLRPGGASLSGGASGGSSASSAGGSASAGGGQRVNPVRPGAPPLPTEFLPIGRKDDAGRLVYSKSDLLLYSGLTERCVRVC